MTLEPTQFATETQLWNAIVRQFGQPLPLPSGRVTLSESEAPDRTAASFAIGAGPDVPLTLVLEEFPFGRLSGVEITLAEVQALPSPLSEGLLLGALDALKIAMPQALTALLVLPGQTGHTATPDTWLRAEVDIGNGALARGRIGGRRQDFVQVLARLFPPGPGQTGRTPAALLEGLSVSVALQAGEVSLSLAAVTALEPGDVVLAEIQADRRRFQIGGRDVTIASAPATEADAPTPGWTVKEMRMTDKTPESDPDTVALSLSDVPLTLRFVTEDRRIALSDLQDLAAGSLLPFEVTPLSAGLPLRIQANGVTIGTGHLVQIDDRYAVRISQMAPKAG